MRNAAAVGLYERDFDLWIKGQAAALRDGRLVDLDIANLTEELEDLSRRNRNEIRSRLRRLGAHILKRSYQPEKATPSWANTVLEQAASIRDIVDDSPSLRREMRHFTFQTYGVARKFASNETGFPLDDFPAEPTAEYLAAIGEALGMTLVSRSLGVRGPLTEEPFPRA